MQKDLERIQSNGLQIVAISYDPVETLKTFSDKAKISFPLLSDDGSKVIRQLDLEYQKGLPHPGTLLVDTQGVVRAKLFKKGYAQRHSTDELLKAAEAAKLNTK